MDYETGSATDPADLISKLGTFAAGDGWTVSSVTGGVVFRKSSIVVGVATDSDEVFLRGAITYDSGAAWNAQTNNSGTSIGVNCGAGPFPTYHFFSGDEDGYDYLHVAFEIVAGVYRHFVFGELVKSGAYTGGVYVSGTVWSAGANDINVPLDVNHQTICDTISTTNTEHVWVDYDAKTNNWQLVASAGTTTTTRCTGSGRTAGLDAYARGIGGNLDWNLRNLMVPLNYYANRASSLKSPIGRIPHMRSVGLNSLSPTEIISIGGDDWMVFPITQRTETFDAGSSVIPSSGFLGYAYRMP